MRVPWNPAALAWTFAVVSGIAAAVSAAWVVRLRPHKGDGKRAPVAVAVVVAAVVPLILTHQNTDSFVGRSAKLVALDVRTGKPIWRASIGVPWIQGIDIGPSAVSVVVDPGTRVSFDRRSGVRLAEPVSFDVHVAVSVNPGRFSTITDYRPDQQLNTITRMSPRGKPLWTFHFQRVEGRPPPHIALGDDVLYVASYGQIPYTRRECGAR
jgi:hypothetical protein